MVAYYKHIEDFQNLPDFQSVIRMMVMGKKKELVHKIFESHLGREANIMDEVELIPDNTGEIIEINGESLGTVSMAMEGENFTWNFIPFQ